MALAIYYGSVEVGIKIILYAWHGQTSLFASGISIYLADI